MSNNSKEFVPWDGDYEKKWTDVLLPDGTIIYGCWPNAGRMNAMDGSGRQWLPSDGISVRLGFCAFGRKVNVKIAKRGYEEPAMRALIVERGLNPADFEAELADFKTKDEAYLKENPECAS